MVPIKVSQIRCLQWQIALKEFNMQMLFRFIPAAIYIAALFAIALSMLIVRSPHVGGPLVLHCQYEKYSDCRLVR
ncbi:MAG: hypothetical protein BGP09_27865 [Rhizobium sp. 60-20]|nr:MAG: hypothetical protein BGP09_27865 [Rhizobium sp. 60-20]